MPIPLVIAGPGAAPLCRQPVNVAVPFRPGAVHNTSGFQIGALGGAPVSAVEPTSHWTDGSVKWALIKSVLEPDATCFPEWHLQCATATDAVSHPPSVKALRVDDTADQITVSDGCLKYTFNVGGPQVFPDVYAGDSAVCVGDDFSIATTGTDNQDLAFSKTSVAIESQDAVSVKLAVEGTVAVSAVVRLDVSLHFEILCGSWMRVGVRIHNPHRARHVEAIWDLGDDGSINFKEFALRMVRQTADAVRLQAEPGGDWQQTTSGRTTLFQASSGGEQWDSPNHVDASGVVRNCFRGYRLESNNNDASHGDRASPVVWIDTANGTQYGFTIRQYWQNFPKCLGLDDSAITIGLFPAEHGGYHELQGGERKHHEIVFSFSDNRDSLNWVHNPVVLSVPVDTVKQSQVLRYSKDADSSTYDQVLDISLSADNGFFAKREVIDEYGWRNFGDIYADHETLYHDSEELFVSHYNNQYDAIYGFGRQFLLTGDNRWYQLMVDLARHVLDIDIYRTEEDRAEYNHGLFWHTDHYKKAHTCSHRTYSHEHYIDWQGDKGGGPGSEHCYTSGLLLYYQLTGDTDARDAVVGLAGWIRHFYEGTGTLLETTKNILSTERHSLVSLCKGHKVFRYKYGFDRGTGNYMRALLDSFEVTGDSNYIRETEAIFKATFADNDDLEERDLGNIELTWFYSIFLQEIIRYLDLKRGLGDLDADFCYARNGLLYYARWMAENEEPYLSRPERLEYPNDTWLAQDIRKANVLYAAYRYATSDREILLTRARYFRDYVLQALPESDTRHFSRIQILMLQNHGPSGLMDTAAEPYEALSDLPVQDKIQKGCFHTVPGFVLGLLKDLMRSVGKFRFRHELNWVRARIG